VAGHKPRWFIRPHTVTHPSTNRARRIVTSLIDTNALPLSQATTTKPMFRKRCTLWFKNFTRFLWPPCVADADIIFLPCGFFLSFYFFIPRLISAVADWMSTILPHMVWPSANLECRSEMCCTRLAANTLPKIVAENRHLGTIAQLCRAISSQLRHVSTIGKKLVKQQYLIHMSSLYGELRPTSG